MEWLGLLPTKPALIAPTIRSLKLLDKEVIGCNACKRWIGAKRLQLPSAVLIKMKSTGANQSLDLELKMPSY